ncbi:MAG TPA: response regulator [Chitinophagaceae bacterium]|jgi:DNA-binding NarL/FixJ family response regulator
MQANRKTILIVDDSAIILDRLTILLQKLENSGEILAARTFTDALRLLSDTTIDIALFDIHLEDRSGIDLLRITREQHPRTVVIMVTNQANDQVETVCKELGATHFLDKSKDFFRIPQIISALI